jgi:hypothetical protein
MKNDMLVKPNCRWFEILQMKDCLIYRYSPFKNYKIFKKADTIDKFCDLYKVCRLCGEKHNRTDGANICEKCSLVIPL